MYAVMSKNKTVKLSLNGKDFTGDKHAENYICLTLNQACSAAELHSLTHSECEAFSYFID